MPRAAALAIAGLAVALAVAVVSGCSTKKLLVPNLPPETVVFVQFDTTGAHHTVNHVVHLYWFGSDPDGSVAGFELRFLNPSAPGDTQWVFTSRTDSLFTVFTPEGSTRPIFEVRAIDDEGLRDPSPARQGFSFSNRPPILTLLNRLGQRDSTFASVTLSWNVTDPDGDFDKLRFLVWLDGNRDNPVQASRSPFTVPIEHFFQRDSLRSGPRTAYVRAIDDGGMAGPVDSMSWFVRAPARPRPARDKARLLIIDDVPKANSVNYITDTLYMNTAARNVPAGEYALLQLEFTRPFRSSKDVEQTFRLFDAVVWYRSTETTFSTILRDYQAGIGAYLEAGGKFYLEGFNLIDAMRAPGPLTRDFASRYLGTDFFFRFFSVAVRDSTAGWGTRTGSRFRSSSDLQENLVLLLSIVPGLRAFGVRDANHVAVWALPGQLEPPNVGMEMPVGVSVPQPSGGRAIVLTFPLRTADLDRNASRFLAKVYQSLGVTDP